MQQIITCKNLDLKKKLKNIKQRILADKRKIIEPLILISFFVVIA